MASHSLHVVLFLSLLLASPASSEANAENSIRSSFVLAMPFFPSRRQAFSGQTRQPQVHSSCPEQGSCDWHHSLLKIAPRMCDFHRIWLISSPTASPGKSACSLVFVREVYDAIWLRPVVLNLWVVTPLGSHIRHPPYQIFTSQLITVAKLLVLEFPLSEGAALVGCLFPQQGQYKYHCNKRTCQSMQLGKRHP